MKLSEQKRVNEDADSAPHPLRPASDQLAKEIGLLDSFGEADLSRPQYDSRKVKPGDAFIAIRGFATDGHKYIKQALTNGAKTIVVEDASGFSREDAEAAGVARLVVENGRRALAIISEAAFGYPSTKLRLIGVTGTNGKTTVTTLIKQMLAAKGEKVGLIGTNGIWIEDRELPADHTTPESRDLSELLAHMVEQDVTSCVMEVSSHALALDRVLALDYDIAVFTNLTQDHLDFHHTMDEYFAAKQKLFNGLKDTAIAVTNADDPRGIEIVSRTDANVHSYGIRNPNARSHSDLIAYDLQLTPQGSKFKLEKRYSEERAEIRSMLVGAFNVENMLAAASALYFGVEGYSLEELAKLIPSVHPARGRFQQIPLKSGVVAIVDYAHTPDALENVLESIRKVNPGGGRIITVFGCGGDRDPGKRPQMGEIAARLSDHVIVTSDNPRSEHPDSIIEAIVAGIPQQSRKNVEIEADRAKAIPLAIEMAKPGDIVLIAGKGHEAYQIIGSERNHFDDAEEVRKCDETR